MMRTDRMTVGSRAAAVVVLLLLVGCAAIEERIYHAGLVVERTRAGVTDERVQTPRESLAYLHREGEQGTIVLLHGFASQKDLWLSFLRELPEGYQVIAPDLPGHGDSLLEQDASYDVRSLAQAVIRGLDALETGPVHVAGTSLGGAVSLAIAVERPQQVLSVGLFNPAGAPGAETEMIAAAARGDGDNPLIATDRESLDALLALVFYDEPVMPWPVRSVLTRYHGRRADIHQQIWKELWQTREPIGPILEQISAPVLLVWGEQDEVFNVRGVEVFERHLGRVTTVILPDSGHTSVVEDAEETARLYHEFLQQSGNGAAP